MTAKPFLDTNILVYALMRSDRRSGQAKALLDAGGVISVQVLNEFTNVGRRKLGRSWQDVRDALDSLAELLDPPLPLTHDLHRAGIDLCQRFGFPFYDGLIVAAAKSAGCGLLLTEDMQHGRRVDGVVIRNPFLDSEA